MAQFSPNLQNSNGRSFRNVLAVLWETEPPICALGLKPRAPWPKERRAAPAIFASFLIHFSMGFFLLSVPLSLFLHQLNRINNEPEESRAPVTVYHLQKINLADYLPEVHPPGKGGRPGRGDRPQQPIARGSSVHDPRVQIVSNPPKPDNDRQTILQPASPPDLRIPVEIRVPNLIAGSLAQVPVFWERAQPKPAPPAQIARQIPVPVPPLPPVLAPHLAVNLQANDLLQPVTPAPPELPPQRVLVADTDQIPAADASAVASDGTANLTTFSVDPAPLGDSIALPPGNRLGAFSISPAGSTQGSPGGMPTGSVSAGKGGAGAGGDASSGVGTASEGGGGGGNAESGATHSITQIADNTGPAAGGTLPLLRPDSRVFPVNPARRPRGSALIVSSGPGGGGGLGIYGVLHGGKIYTVYLPMPGKNWILQYCASSDSAHDEKPSRTVQVQMEPMLAPPEGIDQFDFHRSPLPKEKATQMIVLQGVIRPDGSVGNLKILKGVEEMTDQAALAAFSRWKFLPANRSGKVIAVDVLVGIPATVPGT